VTLIGQSPEDIIIEGNQRKKVVISLSISSLFPEFTLSSFLPLFCHLIWKDGGSSYYSTERWDSSSDGFIDS
jgi:hypothetical protein